jgi:hypothetical protein
LACLAIAGIGVEALLACGDKFLLVGRGVSFRHAYAAIHPASILIVLPPKTVKVAAVRDSGLREALRMAGHRVEIVQQPANLSDVLGRSRHDIVLVERTDASAIGVAAGAAIEPKPSIVTVEERSSTEPIVARQQLEYVLQTPQRLPQILSLLDDIMKARLVGQRRAATSGL